MANLFKLDTGKLLGLIGKLAELGVTAEMAEEMLKNPEVAQRRVGAFINPMLPQIALRDIDLDADPFVPDGWKVEEHQKGGTFTWDPNQVELHLEEAQKRSPWMKGALLREALKGKRVMNANLLDWLLAHPDQIPESWKGKAIFFWGTIYRYSDDRLCVRCLVWDGSRWRWNYGWLGRGWFGNNPAVLRK